METKKPNKFWIFIKKLFLYLVSLGYLIYKDYKDNKKPKTIRKCHTEEVNDCEKESK